MNARRALAAALLATTLGAVPASASSTATAPPRLSRDPALPVRPSDHGSGVFGQWGLDDLGLPRYRYTLDQAASPAAAQAELNGSRDAWHQLGNDHIVADAFNHGYVQLWSQDRMYQWANYHEASGNHFAGGYGYLHVDGRAYSTLYSDRPAGAETTRDFGTGYVRRTATLAGIAVDERVYAPFGDDPVLLHDVTLTNTTSAPKRASWFEYWDVNPYAPGPHAHRGLAAPTYDEADRTLAVAQLPFAQDPTNPLSIFAAALSGPVEGFETDASAFFGAGGRAAPDEVAADRLSGTLSPPALDSGLGHTMLGFRAPVTLAPGASVTLRYAYGMAHPAQIAPLVARRRDAADPFTASEQAWADWLPQVSLGSRHNWLARELRWDAYTLRSGESYEECAGRHILSQGGYYQYDLGFQGAFRDPLQHVMGLVYAQPELVRDVLVYSAQEQPRWALLGQIPYAIIPPCVRLDLGTSDDLDIWLLLTAAEYGLATRDTALFDEPVKWSDGGTATLWKHLEQAFAHQEAQRGPHGLYTIGATGDWSDFSTAFMQITESTLVATQAAYIYPRLAQLADLRGDAAFAKRLRDTAAGLRDTIRGEWTGEGWYSRGYSLTRQLGKGVIYEEPQPWAMLAGIPTDAQAQTLGANVRRYLTGVGAPGGPSPIGTSQSPAANDPGVHETSPGGGVGDGHAVFVGGSWFALNGSLVWALGELDGVLPTARADAFDELVRNTLATHATAYPDHWNGVISVDDACRSWYSTNPAQCGIGLSTAYDTQIMHQPAWSLWDVIKLAGIEPDTDGYRITPHLPMRTFTVRLPQAGVASAPGVVRGYVRPLRAGTLRMRVAPPSGSGARPRLVAYAGQRRVPTRVEDGLVVFDLLTRAGEAADWAVRRIAEPRPRRRP